MRSTSRLFVVCVTVVGASLLPAGCPLGAALTGGGGTPRALTLIHAGVDFSEGVVGTLEAEVENNDGETVGWSPLPNNWVYSETEVWFRPAANTDDVSYTKDMGAVALGSVTAVPASWDGGAGQDLAPLEVGHVYIVKCLDGYAKFLVKAIRPAEYWAVDVEYVFTSGTTFGG